MAQILYTIDEYVTKERKRDTYWMVFNTFYNDVHALHKELIGDDIFSNYLKEEFLSFMKSIYPQVKMINVFDLVSAEYLILEVLL